MRIGFDAKRLFNNFTGLGNHSRTTIDILARQFPKCGLHLYTPRIPDNDISRRYASMPQCIVHTPRGVLRGSLWRTFGMAEEVSLDSIDVFHGLSNELPLGLRRRGVPSVVTIHDVAFRTFPDMYHWQDRLIYDKKWEYACKSASRIIAISQCTKRDIVRFYGVDEKKISVVYQPVNSIYYGPLPDTDKARTEPYMLYVGSVNSRKNLMGVVKAMSLLPKDLQIPLVVVGNGGGYRRKVEQFVADNGLGHLVKWQTANDHQTLQRLYAGARLFVYPSFYEGFGLPVVEAQLCGCPVITSDVSSLPEAGGPHAFTVSPDSAEQIAHTMRQLITDDELCLKAGREGREHALKAFDPARLACQLMDEYKSVM